MSTTTANLQVVPRGEREVVPRVIQLMAAVGDEDDLYAEFFGGGVEGARLVAEFGSEEEKSFWGRHEMSVEILTRKLGCGGIRGWIQRADRPPRRAVLTKAC